MKIIRPITADDYEGFKTMAFSAHTGMSLPKDPVLLRQKIIESTDPSKMIYTFILEDLNTKKVEGTCSIRARTGILHPCYFYRIESVKNASSETHIPDSQKILRIVKFENGPSEICALYMLPEFRKEGYGRLLSLSRFLFIANQPDRFHEVVFADMRGEFTSDTMNAFWEGIGRHFFDVSIDKALDYMQHHPDLIHDILPSYPIYISLLPETVQASLGAIHPNTKPAVKLLEQEGFTFSGEINTFDGGPKLQVPTSHVRSIRESVTATLQEIIPHPEASPDFIISNTSLNFRATQGTLHRFSPNRVGLSKEIAEALQLKVGDPLRYVPNKS